MSTELELTSRLDALGRSLAPAGTIEPPPVFLAGVKHQHRVTLVKKTGLGVGAAALVIAVVMVASRRQSEPPLERERPPVPRRMELPALGAMRSLVNSPDDIDDAPLLPPKASEEGAGPPARLKEWRKELLD
jgi:hypothetical protein